MVNTNRKSYLGYNKPSDGLLNVTGGRAR